VWAVVGTYLPSSRFERLEARINMYGKTVTHLGGRHGMICFLFLVSLVQHQCS